MNLLLKTLMGDGLVLGKNKDSAIAVFSELYKP